MHARGGKAVPGGGPTECVRPPAQVQLRCPHPLGPSLETLHTARRRTAVPSPFPCRPPSGCPSRQKRMKCDKCFDYNKGVKQGKCSKCGNTNACFQ